MTDFIQTNRMNSELKLIEKELDNLSFQTRYSRKDTAGIGKFLIFSHNLQRRHKGIGESANSRDNPQIHDLLFAFCKKHVKIPFDIIQINKNYLTKPHTDSKNVGDQWIVGFGDYVGGEVFVENEKHNIQYNPLIFNGAKKTHYTAPFEGKRYVIICYQNERK